jgi:hypothetical protein
MYLLRADAPSRPHTSPLIKFKRVTDAITVAKMAPCSEGSSAPWGGGETRVLGFSMGYPQGRLEGPISTLVVTELHAGL